MPTLTEKNVLKVFNKHKRKLIKSIGTNSTTDGQLNIIGNQLFRNQYIGTYSQDNLPFHKIKNKSFAIINTDTKNKGGVHWVALYFTPKTVFIWDSYGRDSRVLLPIFTKQLSNRNIKFKDSDPDADQSKKSKICGPLCLSWMLTVKEVGVKNAMKV
jgi:hypothetical protein